MMVPDRSLIRALAVRALGRHPRDSIGILVAALATGAILVNALYLQPGPHPAPIFRIKPRPVASAEPTGSVVAVIPRPRPPEAGSRPDAAPRSRADVLGDIQRELVRRGFYDGPVDGIYGPRTDGAIRDYEQAAGLKPTGEPTEDLLRALARSSLKAAAPARSAAAPARPDPIAEIIAPSSRRVLAVQRALADFGYGQLKANGQFGPETQAAIEKFERERKLPITGQISDRLMRELAAVTGRPLE